MAVGKNIINSERYKMIFDAEAFNVFNDPTFASVNANLGDPLHFGVVTDQSNSPRLLEFGLRVQF